MIYAHPYVPYSPLAFSNSMHLHLLYLRTAQTNTHFGRTYTFYSSASRIATAHTHTPFSASPSYSTCRMQPPPLFHLLNSIPTPKAASSSSVHKTYNNYSPLRPPQCNSSLCSRTSSRTKLPPQTHLNLLPFPLPFQKHRHPKLLPHFALPCHLSISSQNRS